MTNRLELFAENIPAGLDAVLITSPVNRRYYLEFASSAGTIIVFKSQNYFIVDSRYFEEAKATVKNCEVVLQDRLYEQMPAILKKHGAKHIGVECDAMTMSEFFRLKERLSGFEIASDDRVSRIIEKQRSVKSEEEAASIQAAQDIADKTFSHILGFIKSGKTELEIAIEMEQFSRREGSEEPAFPFIVAAGRDSSKPHAVPSKNEVRDGDFIVLDYGATVNGYRSDMTRTVGVGNISPKQHEVYEIVLKAQLAALDAVKAGVRCDNIDRIARNIIDVTEYKGLFGHGLGHSLGLQIHESPRFSRECAEILVAGTVMSVEPGIYIPGEFGVRIEDIVIATRDGYHNFVKSDKNLIIL